MTCSMSALLQVTNHALAGIEKIIGHYGHNRLKVSYQLYILQNYGKTRNVGIVDRVIFVPKMGPQSLQTLLSLLFLLSDN